MNNKYILALSAGHVAVDMNYGALMAMLPFLIAGGGLNYAQAAGLSFASALSSSLTQPVFGIIADKLSKAWLLPLGILLAGCGIAIIGFFPNDYWIMFAAAIASGLGVAAFHPEGASISNRLAGKKKGRSISIFSVGGTIGIAIGPLLIAPAMLYLGLRGSAILAVPAIAVSAMLLFMFPRMRSLAEVKDKEEAKPKEELKNEWGKFSWLGIAITCRSVIAHSFNVFIPLYWMSVLHQSKAASGMIISYMTFLGAIVIIVSGNLADRFGMNKVIKAGWLFLLPSIFFLTKTSSPILAMLILAPVVIGNYTLNTPLIVLGQQYLPKNVGFASGVTMGLGVSIGGIAAPILGSYADVHGLESVFNLLTVLPLLGLAVAFTSKAPEKPL